MVVVPLADELVLAVKGPMAGAAPTLLGSTPLAVPPRRGGCSAVSAFVSFGFSSRLFFLLLCFFVLSSECW